MATGRPTRFKWQHRGGVTHSTLLPMRSKLVVLGEQSGFTPRRSTTDRIFTLNTIIQSRKKFQKPLWIAFVDLKAAFDSADRMALWKQLRTVRSLGLHGKAVDLIEGPYTDTCSCVNVDGVMSDWFAVGCGVRQGCRTAPDLFLGPIDNKWKKTWKFKHMLTAIAHLKQQKW